MYFRVKVTLILRLWILKKSSNKINHHQYLWWLYITFLDIFHNLKPDQVASTKKLTLDIRSWARGLCYLILASLSPNVAKGSGSLVSGFGLFSPSWGREEESLIPLSSLCSKLPSSSSSVSASVDIGSSCFPSSWNREAPKLLVRLDRWKIFFAVLLNSLTPKFNWSPLLYQVSQ